MPRGSLWPSESSVAQEGKEEFEANNTLLTSHSKDGYGLLGRAR